MKIHHIGYLVKHMEKAQSEFAALGFVQQGETVYDSYRDAQICFWEKDGYVVELVSPASAQSVVYDLLKRYKNMPYHICYLSENLSGDIEKLTQAGYFQIDEPAKAPALGGRKVCFLMNAQIGMIELLEENA